MSQKETIKRILKEELSDTRLIRQKRAIERLLNAKSFEGVCGYVVTEDKIDNRVGAVILKFSNEWYMSNDESVELNRKLKSIQTTKHEIEKTINRFLGIKNVYVGNVLSDCNSSSEDK